MINFTFELQQKHTSTTAKDDGNGAKDRPVGTSKIYIQGKSFTTLKSEDKPVFSRDYYLKGITGVWTKK